MFGFRRKEADYDVFAYLDERSIEILRDRIQAVGGPTASDPEMGEIEVMRLTTASESKLKNTLDDVCKACPAPPACRMHSGDDMDYAFGRELRLKLNSKDLKHVRNKLANDTTQFASVRDSSLNSDFTTRLPRARSLILNAYAHQLIDETVLLSVGKIAILNDDGNEIRYFDFLSGKAVTPYVPQGRSDKPARSHSKRKYAVIVLGVFLVISAVLGFAVDSAEIIERFMPLLAWNF